MTPNELDLVMQDGEEIVASADGFSTIFYETLFEIAPDTRSMFPADLTEQRGRLVGELVTLVHAATSWRETGSLDRFVERANKLGRRHADYGVLDEMYNAVEIALLAALGDTLAQFDDEHEAAWSKLYGLVATTMREGAAAER